MVIVFQLCVLSVCLFFCVWVQYLCFHINGFFFIVVCPVCDAWFGAIIAALQN